MQIQKSNIQLKVQNKTVNTYLASPEQGGPGILVLHAWWGLKPFFKEWCDRLAAQGFMALAPDLREGQIATTIDEAQALMEKSDHQFAGEVVLAAKDYLLSLPSRQGEKIGVMGFSMGGYWSLMLAMRDADKVAATVLYYGSGGPDFTEIRSKIMGHFSEDDEWEPMKEVRSMEAGMKAAGVDVTIHFYPGVSHWFAEEDRPEYNPAAAGLAWERTIEFLKKNLY